MDRALIAIAAALAALGCIGGAFGTAKVASKAVEGVARQPEASGKITSMLVVGAAFSELTAILCFLVAVILSGKI
ncbi:ATP synthase F0 subunit C [Clostridium thermarum]|uniref:ATP synthase F0 subunit C n=1 Tax=Clostridium thermarum TaxID=1716543 RepID=UPI001122F303|nr:ATP synthase F0 subunit C [Clostridium thermarum]